MNVERAVNCSILTKGTHMPKGIATLVNRGASDLFEELDEGSSCPTVSTHQMRKPKAKRELTITSVEGRTPYRLNTLTPSSTAARAYPSQPGG